jgi:hypothetical protein
MTQPSRRPRIMDFGFYIIVIIVGTGAWASQSYMQSLAQKQILSRGGIVGPELKHLTDLQSEQLGAYFELNRLLTTLATTLLGAVFFFLFGGRKANAWEQHWWAAVLGVLLVCVSIFFGYVAYLIVIAMLREGTFDLGSYTPYWAQWAHFYTFLAGVIFFADFAYHNLIKEHRHEN